MRKSIRATRSSLCPSCVISRYKDKLKEKSIQELERELEEGPSLEKTLEIRGEVIEVNGRRHFRFINICSECNWIEIVMEMV